MLPCCFELCLLHPVNIAAWKHAFSNCSAPYHSLAREHAPAICVTNKPYVPLHKPYVFAMQCTSRHPLTLTGTSLHIWHFRKLKYYELQDAWDSVQASSVLTVPIPALRRYESASITEESAASKSEADTSCHVLHSLSGAVGIVNFGLNTEDIKLEGRCDPNLQSTFICVFEHLHLLVMQSPLCGSVMRQDQHACLGVHAQRPSCVTESIGCVMHTALQPSLKLGMVSMCNRLDCVLCNCSPM